MNFIQYNSFAEYRKRVLNHSKTTKCIRKTLDPLEVKCFVLVLSRVPQCDKRLTQTSFIHNIVTQNIWCTVKWWVTIINQRKEMDRLQYWLKYGIVKPCGNLRDWFNTLCLIVSAGVSWSGLTVVHGRNPWKIHYLKDAIMHHLKENPISSLHLAKIWLWFFGFWQVHGFC